MPFEEHPDLTTPPDTTVLWRYMDFAGFVHLIETQILRFSRADQFEDPLEGTLTDAELEYIRSNPLPSEDFGITLRQAYVGMSKLMRVSTYVNCWRAGDGESLAMWDLYGKGNGIVAVKSTVGLLKNEFNRFSGSIFFAKVLYIDWASAPWHENALIMCARKDSSYQHESEVRAMIFAPVHADEDENSLLSGNPKAWYDRAVKDAPLTIEVSIDVSALITEVVVGPRERPWVAELVKRVLKRYGLQPLISVSNRLTPRVFSIK
jgi:hypothetical protein